MIITCGADLIELHALKLKSTNPVKILADDISRETKVLCLDEFQVVDVADAMLLRNLLEMLISRDLQFVITSNRHPSELYLNGIQRQSFLPCIELLEKRLEVVRLTGEDYRRKDAQDEIRIFQWPINDDTTKRLKVIFHRLCKGRKVISQTISTHGRSIEIEKSAGDVAMFSFEELCSQPRSAADYLSIASRFKTIVLEKVPIMDFTHRDEARRFITMIDVFYDNKIRLVLQSNAPPEKLFELGRESCLTLQSERSLADELSLTDKDLV
jgi:protein AFG1